MDWDERAERIHYEQSLAWSGRFNDKKETDIAQWVSSFRDNFPSELVDNRCGSFNWSCRIRFDDGLQWMVRFAVPGKIMDGDEKVHREVNTMQFLKAKTKIPVPSIITWGYSCDNPLGLGPYIIMEFIDGLPLDEIIRQPIDTGYTLRSDIDGRELDIIFRQIANVYLELASHDFPYIGALSNPLGTGVEAGPLTLKINEIESHGGVEIRRKSKRYDSNYKLTCSGL